MSNITIAIPSQTIINKSSISQVFLPSGNQWQSTENQSLSVIESGSQKILFEGIIAAIHTAKKIVCLQSFLIQDTALIDALTQATRRGVHVYILDAAETRLTDSYEDEDRVPEKDYKKMLVDKFEGHFFHRQASFFHGKYILIDPQERYGKACLFTGNFNIKPFVENPELGIWLTPEQRQELYQVFVYHFWEHATHEQNATKDFTRVHPLNRFKPPVLQNLLITSPNEDLISLKPTLLAAIQQAKKSITLSTFGLDYQHELVQAIAKKQQEGVQITIFCRPRQKTIIGHIDQLQKAGATVYCHELIHAKSLLIDEKNGYIFSANFEHHGMDSGLEVGAVLTEQQIEDLKTTYASWQATFPYQFVDKVAVKDMPTEYYQLPPIKGRLYAQSIKKQTEKPPVQKKISRVEELFSLVSGNLTADKDSKETTYFFEASLKHFPYENHQITQTIAPNVLLVSFDKSKKKKGSAILLTTSQVDFDVNLLKAYKKENIYGKKD